MKLSEVKNAVSSAVSGGYVCIKSYTSDKSEVSDITGHICPNYGKAKEQAIADLETAINEHTLKEINVKGQCYKDGDVWNSRKRSYPLKEYDITYTVEQVEEAAKGILDSWKNPKERENNEVALTEKGQRGLVINLETGRIEFDLLIEKQVYNQDASDKAKEGKEEKPEISMPESKLKDTIRKMFMRKMKTFVLEQGKFESLAVNGIKFASSEIEF